MRDLLAITLASDSALMAVEGLVAELERKIAELKKQWPVHSVSPALMAQLDELEERLQQAKEAVSSGEFSPDKASQSLKLPRKTSYLDFAQRERQVI